MQAVLVMFRSDGERRSFSLSREMTVIGRRQDCDLMIPLNEISRKHCRFIRDGDELRLEDLGSSNGTFCNGRRIQEAILQPGDTVQVGPVTFVVQIDGQPEDDEIQPFANSAGGDTDVQEIDHDDMPSKSRAQGGGVARGAAAVGAAAAIGAAAGAGDDDDDLMEIPDDDDADGLMELPSEDDLLNDLSSSAPLADDDEPLDMLDDEPPAQPVVMRPAAPVAPKSAPIEDELDVLEDDLTADSGAPHALETEMSKEDDTPLAFDDTPLPLNTEEPLPMEESPSAVDTESYRAPGEPPLEAPAAGSPATYDDVLGITDDAPLSLDEPLELADPLAEVSEDELAAPVAEIPTLGSEGDLLEMEDAESPLELSETELLGDEAATGEDANLLGADFAIGHQGSEAPAPLGAEARTPEGVASADSDALGADDAPLDFSDTDDLLELAEDPDGDPATGHAPMNEDELLDLLGGGPAAHPHDPNASPTDRSANH